MLFRKKFIKIFFAIVLFALCLFPTASKITFAESEYVYLGGFPAGFTLNTTSVEVVGLCDIVTDEGVVSPAREAGIKVGDIIDKINGESVKKTNDINKLISREYKKYEVSVLRNGESKNIDIVPAKELSSGQKKLGALVKDSVNGIGTITYIDSKCKKYGALGHPVTDNTGKVMEINGGTVYGCLIYDVKKGVRGTPGELKGAFENNNIIGKADTNTSSGLYGELSSEFNPYNLLKIETGPIETVKIGKACIYTTLYGNEIQKYDISIVKVEKQSKDNRDFVLKIDDSNLLEKTGGIVQGMSGSPIVQNGKLVGAVTHVFINDPTRGYGISIDKML
jgi:stage IV sporulation protein B